VRRPLLVLVAVAVLAVGVYLFLLRGSTVEPRLVSSQPVAAIGSGSDAVPVAADGTILAWLPAPEEGDLPKLPIDSPPKEPRLQGSVLEQVHVLAATPPALSPYVEGTSYGESGVDVNLTSGIELRFGDATQASRKWRAVAALLANPSITALDYVDVQAPSHPAVGGSGHALPPIP
jgi:cell division septal protein FtsQ